MTATSHILKKVLVGPYYRENAGFFLFIFIIFFGIVAPSQQWDYHYSLIRGMLQTPIFFYIVLGAWLCYAIKCGQWVRAVVDQPDHRFLQIMTPLRKQTSYRLLLKVQCLLFIPVAGYALVVVGVAFYNKCYAAAIVVLLFNAAVCTLSTFIYQYWLTHPGKYRRLLLPFLHRKANNHAPAAKPYWLIFIRFIIRKNKMLFGGLKLFGCTLLYLMLQAQNADDHNLRMPFLLYGMVLFGHGLLIYRCREMEEKYLLFYRSLPVPLIRRFLQYAILYFLVLLPEIWVIGRMTPDPLRSIDALGFVLSGYAVLLLMNSILFMAPVAMTDFLRMLLGIFAVLYIAVLADRLIALSGLFLLVAGALFFYGYSRYNHSSPSFGSPASRTRAP